MSTRYDNGRKDLVIYKFPLLNPGRNEVKVPKDGCKFLSAGLQNNQIYIWLLGSKEGFTKITEEDEYYNLNLYVVTTGLTIKPQTVNKCIASINTNDFVVHIFTEYYEIGNGVEYGK